MIHKIDWISYTFWANEKPGNVALHTLRAMLTKHLPEWSTIATDQLPAGKRKGFAFGMTNKNHTMSAYISLQGLILIEVTGQGCTILDSKGILEDVLQQHQDRITRLDLATDILTDISPIEFVAKRGKTRVTAVGQFTSKTGETCYVGSKKSDRTAKVYRYFDPHPRAPFLRIEYTYRSKQAVFATKHLLQHGIEQTIFSSAQRYAWEHPAWQPGPCTAEELKAWRPERGEGKTVNWLRTQVAQAVKRLHESGVMDVHEYCEFLLSATA